MAGRGHVVGVGIADMGGKVRFRDNARAGDRDAEDRALKRMKPGGRNQVDAGGAAHLAAFEGERSRVAKLRPAAGDLDNIRISGKPDSQK